MTDLPFIPVAAPVIGEREIAYVTDAVRSGWVSSIGPYIERFERDFAALCGARHAIAVANGTVALHLAFAALGIGPGDEVIVPDLTFVATAHAALAAGATPVFADVEPDTWCLDPVAVERALGPKTRAIVPVHLYGHPADMDALGRLARAAGVALVEDAAEAHGATLGGRVVGALGRVATFSFYGNKILTTGEGGMVTTDDEALAARLRLLKDHGMRPERRYFHSELAWNYRMTNLQAALGVAQIEQAEEFIAQKRRIFGWYREELGARTDLELNVERPGARNVYWMTSAVLGERAATSRDGVAAELRAAGVDSRPFFVPMSELPHLARYRKVGRSGNDCPVARRLGARGLNLPSGCGLFEADVRRAARTLAHVLDRSAAASPPVA
ncbi:MAG: DegT/DnrJ/EryC1/StrS family aminotransferase [Polyangiaceae bacterium]|nr:DegT/DnrJ/EryC1/StrS family aminotransferase [Polyangiaceae bacterium]